MNETFKRKVEMIMIEGTNSISSGDKVRINPKEYTPDNQEKEQWCRDHFQDTFTAVLYEKVDYATAWTFEEFKGKDEITFESNELIKVRES